MNRILPLLLALTLPACTTLVCGKERPSEGPPYKQSATECILRDVTTLP